MTRRPATRAGCWDLSAAVRMARSTSPIGSTTIHPSSRSSSSTRSISSSIDPDGFCARVRELAERLESIPRAGLTPCLEAGVTAEGRIYVVAPYVAGSSVESYLSNRRRSASERVAIAGRLCALVAHLHHHGIIHGSVKSPNVIVAESPTGAVPSLLDVGILHAINQSRASRSGPAFPDDLTACKLHDVHGLRGVLIPLLGDTPVRDTDAARSAEALAALLASP